MATEEKNKGLLEFDWENENDSYFGLGDTKTPEQIAEDKAKAEAAAKEAEDKNKGTTTPGNEEEDDEDDFEAFKTPEVKTGKEEEEEEDTSEEGSYKEIFKDLKETGLFKHVEVADDEEIDADKLLELQEEEYEAEVNFRLKEWATNDLDADAKAFIKFKREGGNTVDFFKTYESALEIPTGDIKDEDHQDKVIRYSLAKEGWDKDEIEDRLQYLSDNGRKEKFAKKYDDKLKEDSEKQKAALIKQAETNKLLAKEQEDTFKNNIKEFLDSTDDLEGIKVSIQEKQKLFNFLTKKDNKVTDTKSVTGFQKKLAEVFQDTNKMVLLAKLVESDFDMSGFEKTVKTKQTRKVKNDIEQRRGLRPSNSGSSLQGKNLAELFN